MPKALIFTYYWPPSGGPAVQRWLSLSKLLSKNGIQTTVIAPHEDFASFAILDESLNNDIDESVRVFKTKSFEILNFYKKSLGKGNIPAAGFANESNPSFLQKLARWVRGNLFFPDPRRGWNRYAIKQAKELLAHENFDWVITAGPPHSTHLIGKELKKRFGLNWLCDFHDSWTGVWYYDELMKTAAARRIDQQMEKAVLMACDNIITVGRDIYAELSQKIGNEKKLRLHSMGYDDDLFDSPAEPNSEVFKICYTGTIASNYQPETFFKVLSELISEGYNIKIDLVGLIADSIQRQIQEIGLIKHVNFVGYVSHREAVHYLNHACMLLLISPNTQQAQKIIPGKIYEYMATRLPILNLATQQTESSRIIDECSAGATFERQQAQKIKGFIKELYAIWEKNLGGLLNNSDAFKRYARSEEAKGLAALLKSNS